MLWVLRNLLKKPFFTEYLRTIPSVYFNDIITDFNSACDKSAVVELFKMNAHYKIKLQIKTRDKILSTVGEPTQDFKSCSKIISNLISASVIFKNILDKPNVLSTLSSFYWCRFCFFVADFENWNSSQTLIRILRLCFKEKSTKKKLQWLQWLLSNLWDLLNLTKINLTFLLSTSCFPKYY